MQFDTFAFGQQLDQPLTLKADPSRSSNLREQRVLTDLPLISGRGPIEISVKEDLDVPRSCHHPCSSMACQCDPL